MAWSPAAAIPKGPGALLVGGCASGSAPMALLDLVLKWSWVLPSCLPWCWLLLLHRLPQPGF